MSTDGSDAAVLTERRDRVLLVTLNRPDQRNAVNEAMADGIAAALDELDADAGLSIGVITGAGKGFCSGMDLKAFVAGESPVVEGRGFAGITQRASAKPLIAAIEGFAVAGGLEVALSCDLIVAARGARLGIPEVKRSLVAAGGGLLRLPRVLPRNIAMEMALTGDPILAERAAELGLVNRLAEPGGALDAALELAEAIAANGPLALAATKRILTDSVDWPDAEFFARQEEIAGLGASVRGRPRGRDRVFGEARARVEGPLGVSRSRPATELGGLAPGGGDDDAATAVVAVLAEVDALPRAQRQAPAHHRQHQRRAQQRGLDVGGHVVVALERVGPVGSAVGDRLVKPGGEVPADVGRGVLVEGQRRRRVLDEEMEHPHAQLVELGQRLHHLARDEVKAPGLGREPQVTLDPHQSGRRATRMSTLSPRNGTPSRISNRRWRVPLARDPSARTMRCHGTSGSAQSCRTAPPTRGAPGEMSP